MEPSAVKTAVRCRKPLVLVVHNSFRYQYFKKFKRRLPGNLYLIHNSEWIQNVYAPLGLPSIVVHPPVSVEAYATVSSREYVTLVNLSEDKGGTVFRRIAKLMPDTKFLAVKGAYEPQVVPLLDNVTVVDNTPNIKEVYGRSAIVLMPSRYESWGRVAIEAMASGIPVVAQPTSGLKESCSDAGIYCDRNEPEEWVREIRRLKTDRAYYERTSAACRRRARELDPQSQLAAMADWLEGLRWKEPTAWSRHCGSSQNRK
jgi:glycosyltransferase involved in cell wall biosynthesis